MCMNVTSFISISSWIINLNLFNHHLYRYHCFFFYLKHTYLIIHLLRVHGARFSCVFPVSFEHIINTSTQHVYYKSGIALLTIAEKSRHPSHRHCGESPEGPHSWPSAKGCRKGGEGGSTYSGCDCRRTSRYFNCTQSNTIRCGWTCVTILLAANLAISY